MAFRPKELSPLALAAALLLAVHTLLAGIAAGAHAAPVEIDAFGNGLCLGEPGTAGDTPANHGAHRDCCDFGCHSPAATPAPERWPVLLRLRPSTQVAWLHGDSAGATSPDRASIRLRGPPLRA